MDDGQFDSLSRALGDGLTRRGLVAILGALASGVADFASRDAAAAKRGKKRKKKKGPRGCIPKCTGTTCGADGCGGTCRCGAGLTCCTGICVNLATDPNNCGFCARVCADNGCVNGACTCNGGALTCPCATPNCVARKQGLPPACADTNGANTGDCSTGADAACLEQVGLGSVCLVTDQCSPPCV
jgi:hypothetical protein